MTELVITKRFNKQDSQLLSSYEADGGYQAIRKAFDMTPEQISETVKNANLRGRGGAGFPAGIKWSFMPKDTEKPHFLCINADEGEPGTFKDRALLKNDPHQLLEGIMIACRAIRAEHAYIYVRGEMWQEKEILWKAIHECREKGYLGKNIFNSGNNLQIAVCTGAGAYICGEETAMINSIEGLRGEPRLKPPFPAVSGVFSMPTTVNNVETLSNVPHIINKGPKWFASLGVEGDGGTRLFGVSGAVKNPGLFEKPQGYNLKKLIFEDAGGLLDGHELQAVIPGGSSCPVLKPDEIDVAHSFDSIKNIGSMAGSGGVIVIPDNVCIVKVMSNLASFYAHESCGQCTPCREGTNWLKLLIQRIETGEGTMQDIDLLIDVSNNMMGNTICPLADAAAMPMLSFVKKFRADFEEHVRLGHCPKNGQIEQ